MDALRVGRSLRALRIRRGWRQADVGAAAGISRSQYARIERGDLRGVPLDDLEASCRALDAFCEVLIRWHGEGLDRLLDAAHARLVNLIVRYLRERVWETAVEVSFNHFGDRGSVDVLGWHESTSTLLVIEVKSVVPDMQAMVAAHDRKARLGPVIAGQRGWKPLVVARLLVVADTSTARARVRELADLFNAAYPERSAGVRRWLREPSGTLAGLLFVRDSSPHVTTKGIAGRQRVRLARGVATKGQ